MRADKITMEELVAYEKATNVVGKNYEDKIMMYRGFNTTSPEENEKKDKELTKISQSLARINSIRFLILREMEKRLLIDLDFDNE